MADTCIVCLGDLRIATAEDPPPDAAEAATAEAQATKVDAKNKSTRPRSKRYTT